jgi:hypothetical protein
MWLRRFAKQRLVFVVRWYGKQPRWIIQADIWPTPTDHSNIAKMFAAVRLQRINFNTVVRRN